VLSNPVNARRCHVDQPTPFVICGDAAGFNRVQLPGGLSR
jgi:hypothetical protein